MNIVPSINDDVKVKIWERVQSLENRIIRTARYWESRTGEDTDEIASTIRMRVVDVLFTNPDLIEKNDTYLINCGVNAFIGEYRRARNNVPLDDNLHAAPESTDATIDISSVMSMLDSESRDILLQIERYVDEPGMTKKSSGQININAFAERIGHARRDLAAKFAWLQSTLSPLLEV